MHIQQNDDDDDDGGKRINALEGPFVVADYVGGTR